MKTGSIVAGTWLFSVLSIIDRATVSFTLATIVSVLAIIHYIIKIRKDIKEK